ncbi:TRAP transporter small permease subunit [Arcobacter peruensis]|uniref:TRAP transporter small permease subunit n=1 Tax=Arcobacter peruensis TaxID=2320140 RepID=UPI000F076F89|nr:TRAP transporter small permease subunit [Arcobacter peruensis]
MNNKDHIIDPVHEFEEISHTYESQKNEQNEKIPKVCKVLDSIVYKIGAAVSWVSLILITVIVVQVLLRYLFSVNFVQLEELQWHLYAVVFMFGLSFTMVNHSHVRVDILRVHFSPRLQRKIEIFGILFMMIPFIFIVIDYGYDLAAEAYRVNESSNSPEGLPYRWIIKGMMPLSFFFLFIASVSRVLRHVSYLIRGEK